MESEVSEATRAVIRQDIEDALSVSSCEDPLLGATFGWLHRVTTNLLHKHGSLVQGLFASILAETPGYEVFQTARHRDLWGCRPFGHTAQPPGVSGDGPAIRAYWPPERPS